MQNSAPGKQKKTIKEENENSTLSHGRDNALPHLQKTRRTRKPRVTGLPIVSLRQWESCAALLSVTQCAWSPLCTWAVQGQASRQYSVLAVGTRCGHIHLWRCWAKESNKSANTSERVHLVRFNPSKTLKTHLKKYLNVSYIIPVCHLQKLHWQRLHFLGSVGSHITTEILSLRDFAFVKWPNALFGVFRCETG